MNEYRKTIDLDPETRSTFVELGPVPGFPPWHFAAQPARYPFPSEKAGFTFANSEKSRHPGRKVMVVTTDGKRFEL
ncbi:hypothetical protein SEA_DARTHPHADER_70 [Mycobacterium phage DarthPhader]|uniref:Uncharacterized protein n=1 Tax=Mycobacterium phage DarthPhader TaxID=1912975 RepID=A0A1I9S416_9CAUD|nr:hypothetical protein KIV60_gp31 [Mycobacterium phage DarthPhader]AOZ61310.1 hypothetical protein SEA_DARTHPHADER_70 [Mycobacterium phage DarthPhader]